MPAPRVVVVTGASAGVGRATAVAFARRGAAVALVARGEAGLAGAAREVEAAGGRACVLPTDVSDAEQVERAAARAEEALGPIEVWVNNAMTTVFAPFGEVEPDEYRRATEVTYLGYVWGTRAALRRMKPRDAGTIVQVGSALAYRSIPLQAPYCGAKAAIRAFTDSLRSELTSEGSAVRLTAVHLPAVDTPQFGWCRARLPKHPAPVPPIYPPERAAAAIVAAADGRRREVVLGSVNRFLVQAQKVAPGVLDHYLARTGRESQQSDLPIDPDRPDDLFRPVDADTDIGTTGIFGHRANGVDLAYLRTVPKALRDLASAAGDSFRARQR